MPVAYKPAFPWPKPQNWERAGKGQRARPESETQLPCPFIPHSWNSGFKYGGPNLAVSQPRSRRSCSGLREPVHLLCVCLGSEVASEHVFRCSMFHVCLGLLVVGGYVGSAVTSCRCCVSCQCLPGGFCVSEKDCGDGSDEKACPEPAGQCIEAHAPSPQNPPRLSQLPGLQQPLREKKRGDGGKEIVEGKKAERESHRSKDMTEVGMKRSRSSVEERIEANPTGREAGT